jgi:hypothetical protein
LFGNPPRSMRRPTMIRAVIIITNGDVKLGVHWSETSSHFMVEKANSADHPLIAYTLN